MNDASQVSRMMFLGLYAYVTNYVEKCKLNMISIILIFKIAFIQDTTCTAILFVIIFLQIRDSKKASLDF
jgi:hypothetical protein